MFRRVICCNWRKLYLPSMKLLQEKQLILVEFNSEIFSILAQIHRPPDRQFPQSTR